MATIRPSRYPSDVLALMGTFPGLERTNSSTVEFRVSTRCLLLFKMQFPSRLAAPTPMPFSPSTQVSADGIDYECVVWAPVRDEGADDNSSLEGGYCGPGKHCCLPLNNHPPSAAQGILVATARPRSW